MSRSVKPDYDKLRKAKSLDEADAEVINIVAELLDRVPEESEQQAA